MVKISVVTPSVRPEGLDIVEQSLKRQTFPKDQFEWLVITPPPFPKQFDAVKDFQLDKQWFQEPTKREGDMYRLNGAWNKGFKEARGELIISFVRYYKARIAIQS